MNGEFTSPRVVAVQGGKPWEIRKENDSSVIRSDSSRIFAPVHMLEKRNAGGRNCFCNPSSLLSESDARWRWRSHVSVSARVGKHRERRASKQARELDGWRAGGRAGGRGSKQANWLAGWRASSLGTRGTSGARRKEPSGEGEGHVAERGQVERAVQFRGTQAGGPRRLEGLLAGYVGSIAVRRDPLRPAQRTHTAPLENVSSDGRSVPSDQVRRRSVGGRFFGAL